MYLQAQLRQWVRTFLDFTEILTDHLARSNALNELANLRNPTLMTDKRDVPAPNPENAFKARNPYQKKSGR